MATSKHYDLLKKQTSRIKALSAAINEQVVEADIDSIECVFRFNTKGKDIELRLVSLMDAKTDSEGWVYEDAVWYGYFILNSEMYYLHRAKNWKWLIEALKEIGAVDYRFLKNFSK